MKIIGSQVGPVTPVQQERIKKIAPSAQVDASQPADQVILSETAEALGAARQALAKVPDVRQEKIDELRRQVQAGTYRPPAEQIADKILAEARLAKQAQQ